MTAARRRDGAPPRVIAVAAAVGVAGSLLTLVWIAIETVDRSVATTIAGFGRYALFAVPYGLYLGMRWPRQWLVWGLLGGALALVLGAISLLLLVFCGPGTRCGAGMPDPAEMWAGYVVLAAMPLAASYAGARLARARRPSRAR